MSDKEDKKSPLRVKGEQKPVKKQSNTSYAIKIILLLVLLGVNIFLINKVVNRSKVKEETKDPVEEIIEKDPVNETVINSWESGPEKFVFTDDHFVYYEGENTYYEGTYTYVVGDEALKEMDYTNEDLKQYFGDSITKENVYSMELVPEKRVINKVDKSKQIKKNTKWWYILIIKDDNNALGYNKTLDKRYELKRVVE